MNFQLDLIKDKVEFFEAGSLQELEKKINTQIENNKAIMLRVKSVSHQTAVADGRILYSAVVHFAAEA
ncbi:MULTISPECIES: YrzA family protein [Bacillus]|uniref:YrzA family protein n=1 Tax=Bacillus cabrialesii subsp. tritici TaxID=2944916 RepID=A0ABT9DML5_9BACI|nr:MULTISPECIES: YrzA family protein [Bacillus]AUZ27251.1 DUF2536 domain-containing protein [Bacillus cereus]KJJ41874.1 hypothetical protein UM89_10190 [Bacillus subtilis]OLQ51682.1 hypothetical protein BHT94_06255 [Bacillus licheniformis]MBU2658345.1 YrzA family protein [Bacillus cabrialesii]MDO8225964.1 YrzA family protein [Bacillus cabrialesii subsp. tritici]